MSNGFPTYKSTSLTGESGVNAVSSITNDHLGWIFRRNHNEHDFGIDGYIDIVTQDGSVTGQCFAVQIKSGESFFKTKTANGYTFYGERKHLNYYLNLPMPVLIIIHDEKNNKTYWEVFDADRTESTQSGWKLNIPKAQEFNRKSRGLLEEILGPAKDHLPEIEAHWAFNDTLSNFDFIHYAIDREDIESKNIKPILDFFNRIQVNDSLSKKFQGRVEISISGYDHDSRELWEIRDVRRWFKKADPKINWFYFCFVLPPAHGFKNYVACLSDTRWLTPKEMAENPGMNVTMDNMKRLQVLESNWPKLNEMTDRLGMTMEENKRISYQVLDAMDIPHE